MLLFRLDVVLLGYFKGDEGVAVYSVAYRLLETLLFVAFAINQAVLPVMSATASPERRRSGYERAMSVAGFIYVPFFVVSLLEGRAILDLLFGTRYGDPAAPALAWLAAAPVFYAAAFFGTSLLISLHRNRTLLFATVTALVVNVVLNLILIPPYGPAGAAAATTVAYGIQTLVSVGSLRRSGEKPRVFVPLLPAAAACVPLAALLLVLDLPVLVELVLGGLCLPRCLAARGAAGGAGAGADRPAAADPTSSGRPGRRLSDDPAQRRSRRRTAERQVPSRDGSPSRRQTRSATSAATTSSSRAASTTVTPAAAVSSR